MLNRFCVLPLLFLLLAGPAVAAPVVSHPPALQVRTAQPAAPGADWLGWLAASGAAFLAIRIRDTATLAQKFVQRAQGAQNDYATGVAAAGQDWESNTKAADQSYAQGVQDAIAKGRYQRGVAAAGASKYVANATKLGAQRYPTGVANAQDSWARGVQPALDKLKSLQLPPRGPRRSPQNQQRANMVALELGKLVDAG
jgi:hypothetical protein